MFKLLVFFLLICHTSFGAELDVLEFLAKMQSKFSQSAVEDADIAKTFKRDNDTNLSDLPEVIINKLAQVNKNLNFIAFGVNKVISFLKENQTTTLKIDSVIPDQLYNQVENQLIKIQNSTKQIMKLQETFIDIFGDNDVDFIVNSNGQFDLSASVGSDLVKVEKLFEKLVLKLKHECIILQKTLMQISIMYQHTDHISSIFFKLTALAFGKNAVDFENMAKSIERSIKALVALGLENAQKSVFISAKKLAEVFQSEMSGLGKQYDLEAKQVNKTANELPSSSSSVSSVTERTSSLLSNDLSSEIIKLASDLK